MKNRVNKQIIKALSVGLAASMALQPVTAFATDGTEGENLVPASDPEPVVGTTASTETTTTPVAEQPAPAAFPITSALVDNAEKEVKEAIDAPVPAPVVEEGAENNEAKNPINAELEKTEEALKNIEKSIEGVDKAIDTADKKSDAYDDALADAKISEPTFEGALALAETAVNTAVTDTETDANTAEGKADEVQNLADQVYADAAAAAAARAQAQTLADEAQDAADDAKAKRAEAYRQLELATKAKTTAETDLGNAQQAYKDADAAEKAAEKELIDTLKKYGVYKADGSLDLNYMNLFKKNLGKSDVYDAVTSVYEAYALAYEARNQAETNLDIAKQARDKANSDLDKAKADKKEADDNLEQAGKDLEQAKANLEKAELVESINTIRNTEVNTWNSYKYENDEVVTADKALAMQLIKYKLYESGIKDAEIKASEDGTGFTATYTEDGKSVTKNFNYTIDKNNYGHYEGFFWKDSVHWLIVNEVTVDTEMVDNWVDSDYYTTLGGERVTVDVDKLSYEGETFDDREIYSYETVIPNGGSRRVEKYTYYVDQQGNKYYDAYEKNGNYYVPNPNSAPHSNGKIRVYPADGYYYYDLDNYEYVYLEGQDAANVEKKTGTYGYYTYTYYVQKYDVTETHYVVKNTEKVIDAQNPKVPQETKKETEYYREKAYVDNTWYINKGYAQYDLTNKQNRFDDLTTKSKINVSDYEAALRDANTAKTNANIANENAKAKKQEVEEAKNAVLLAANALRFLRYNKTVSKAELDTLQDAYDAAVIRLNDANTEYAKAVESANRALDEADRAQGLVASVSKIQSSSSSSDNDDTPSYGGGDDTTFIPVAVTPATNVVAPAADNAQAPAVLGARTTRRTAAKSAADTDTVATDNSNGNSDNSAVAGAQKEETKTPEAPKTETTIEETETALAATPELEEKGFAWWWLLILAAIAGVSVEEYARRKSNKAKAEAKDSTKINK